ncbi:fungal-specific transcription factor domain-containing protein, partial [Mycena rebaudengoi]
MSSNDDDRGEYDLPNKKRKVQRACDTCRRRKSKCDGGQVPGPQCSTCIESGLACTYLVPPAKRAGSAFVKGLEARLVDTEARLEQAEATIRELRASLNKPVDLPASSVRVLQHALQSLSHPPPPSRSDDDIQVEKMANRLEALSLAAEDRHFVGASSGASLLTAAIDLKERYTSLHASSNPPVTQPWSTCRLHYWTFKPWVSAAAPPASRSHSSLIFPSSDHLALLVDAYFTHVNVYLPLLHRPTFERAIQDGLHLLGPTEDAGRGGYTFGATVLLVCALGSRYLPVDRVAQGTAAHDQSTDQLRCGWEWFDQVPLIGNHFLWYPTLYDLQFYCLAAQFLEAASALHGAWKLIGIGLRLAGDVGAHRRKHPVERPSVEGELWKRAFWVLVYMDRRESAGMGRGSGIQFEEFDLDPPIECDDEYWEDPYHPFEQPAGVPSKVAFFNCVLTLSHILAYSLKLLYPLAKARHVFAVEDIWEETIVAELDSTLNRWQDEVPVHLRWDPERKDPVFFDQSVALYCDICTLKIMIHRRFIPMLRDSAPTALVSLATCTGAARSCANVVDVQRGRKGRVPVPFNIHAVKGAGVVLLLSVWSTKRAGLVPNRSEVSNVHKCMQVLKLCEERWQSAGLFWDILSELASVGELPLPNDVTTHDDAFVPPLPNVDTPECPTYDPVFAAPPPPPFADAVEAGVGGMGLSGASNTWLPPGDPFAGMNGGGVDWDDMMRVMNGDITMWTTAPHSYELDDWGAYFANLRQERD